MRKSIYEKPIANLILNSERVKAFTLHSGARQGWPPLLLLFHLVLEQLAKAEKSNIRHSNLRSKTIFVHR